MQPNSAVCPGILEVAERLQRVARRDHQQRHARVFGAGADGLDAVGAQRSGRRGGRGEGERGAGTRAPRDGERERPQRVHRGAGDEQAELDGGGDGGGGRARAAPDLDLAQARGLAPGLGGGGRVPGQREAELAADGARRQGDGGAAVAGREALIEVVDRQHDAAIDADLHRTRVAGLLAALRRAADQHQLAQGVRRAEAEAQPLVALEALPLAGIGDAIDRREERGGAIGERGERGIAPPIAHLGGGREVARAIADRHAGMELLARGDGIGRERDAAALVEVEGLGAGGVDGARQRAQLVEREVDGQGRGQIGGQARLPPHRRALRAEHAQAHRERIAHREGLDRQRTARRQGQGRAAAAVRGEVEGAGEVAQQRALPGREAGDHRQSQGGVARVARRHRQRAVLAVDLHARGEGGGSCAGAAGSAWTSASQRRVAVHSAASPAAASAANTATRPAP